MEKIKVDVVGLYHWDVRDRWKEYAAEAVGKQLVLQPQPENVKDPYAVRVREGRQHIGYVAVTDLDVVYQALKGSGSKRFRGIVVESNAEPPVLTVAFDAEVDWNYEPFDDSVYEDWHYDGLSLMPKRVEQLGDLTTDLIDELESSVTKRDGDLADGGKDDGVANRDSILEMVSQLLESNLYDVSREMTRARFRVERLLADSGDEALQEAARRMRHQKGMLMIHDTRDEVARYLFVELPTALRQKGLESSHYTYDNRLDELEAQLRAFPFQLYDKFLSDPVDFLREVYYKHVPRQYLFKLLSGIILMILKGRVSIKQWGREGDREPIGRIESLSQSASADDKVTPSPDDDLEDDDLDDDYADEDNEDDNERQQAMREAIGELLEMTDSRGNHIISAKNQWAAIISILWFDYGEVADSLKEMCEMMDEWGFGKDSGYKYYCDYESVAKSKYYARRPFKEWKGQGAAHQRQVKAAVELRVILRPKIGYK